MMLTPRVLEWVKKAEVDFRAANKLLEDPDSAEAVCFHAQQCAEKYLKALLEVRGVPFQGFTIYPGCSRSSFHLIRISRSSGTTYW